MDKIFKNKKQSFFILVLIIFILITVCLLRFSSPEDYWVCKNGTWFKHGRPTSAYPASICPLSNSKSFTSTDVVENFYNWYFYSGDQPVANGAYKNSDFLTWSFKNRINISYKSNQREIFDPFICNHTENPLSFSTQEIYNKNNKSLVMVFQNYASSQDRMEIYLIKNSGFWYITNIVCAKPFASIQNIDLGQKILNPVTQISLYFPNLKLGSKTNDCSQVFLTTRKSKSDNLPLKDVLNQLFIGPTEQEKNQGYTSWFSTKTKNILKDVSVKDGVAYINLIDIRQILPNVSSSCGYSQFKSSIEKTVSASVSVNKVIFSIENNPKTFYDWVGQPVPGTK